MHFVMLLHRLCYKMCKKLRFLNLQCCYNILKNIYFVLLYLKNLKILVKTHKCSIHVTYVTTLQKA